MAPQAPEVALTDLSHSSVLRPLSVLILAAGLLVVAANWLALPSLVRPAPILLTLVGATMWLLVRQGRPSWAAHVMCWGLAAGSWVGGYAAGGLWSVSWVAMPIACMASGWLLGQRTTVLLTCVGVLEAVSMFALHWQGHGFNEQRPPATALIGIVVAMVSASLMSIMTMRALRQQVAGTLALQAQYHAMLQQTQQAIAQSRQQERDRLLQDMHDGFGSQLASARLLAQQGHLSPAQLPEVLDECMADLHLVVDTLSEPQPALADALVDMRFRTQRRLCRAAVQLHWQIELDALPALTPRVVLQLLRMVQEALNNALKHAQARHIWIAAVWHANSGQLHIAVRDDGVGSTAATSHLPGRGLHNMQHRARDIGATLTLHTQPPCFAVELCFVPIPTPPLEAAPA